MAVQENTKPVTDHLNDVLMRIAQAKAVLRSLAENCDQDSDGIHFGDGMQFDEVTAVFWAVDDLLEQAKDFGQEAYKAACQKRYSNLVGA